MSLDERERRRKRTPKCRAQKRASYARRVELYRQLRELGLPPSDINDVWRAVQKIVGPEQLQSPYARDKWRNEILPMTGTKGGSGRYCMGVPGWDQHGNEPSPEHGLTTQRKPRRWFIDGGCNSEKYCA